MIHIERVYEKIKKPGKRFLVDRLWPRGVSKESLRIDAWLKDVSPGEELRQWFHHEPGKWPEFKEKYFQELDTKPGAVAPLVAAARSGEIILVYAARDTRYNNAVALKEYLETRSGIELKRNEEQE